MRVWRTVLFAMFLAIPLTMTARAQVVVGVGVGPAIVPAPVVYGPPVCDWGYYPYYPYSCAPYGYYGSDWFVNGLFIGVGPWYRWGWHGGYGYRAGFGYRGAYGHGGRVAYAGAYRSETGVRAVTSGGSRGSAGVVDRGNISGSSHASVRSGGGHGGHR